MENISNATKACDSLVRDQVIHLYYHFGYSVKQLILVIHLVIINNNKNNIYTINKYMLNFRVKLKTTYFIPVGLVLLIIIF